MSLSVILQFFQVSNPRSHLFNAVGGVGLILTMLQILGQDYLQNNIVELSTSLGVGDARKRREAGGDGAVAEGDDHLRTHPVARRVPVSGLGMLGGGSSHIGRELRRGRHAEFGVPCADRVDIADANLSE